MNKIFETKKTQIDFWYENKNVLNRKKPKTIINLKKRHQNQNKPAWNRKI